MTIKPKYFSEKDTPLAYYKLLRVLSIAWLLVSVGRLFNFILEDNSIGMIEMVIAFVIQFFVVIGLYRKQWSGVVALYCLFAFNILDVLAALGIYVYYDVADAYILGETIGNIIGILIWGIPTWMYFSKRRPLFAPYKENAVVVCQTPGTTYTMIVGEQKNKFEKYQVCIFDVSTGILRKEMRDIDVIKFPPSKFSANNTYYAIEAIRDGKKVRTYYEKNNWDKQIETSL